MQVALRQRWWRRTIWLPPRVGVLELAMKTRIMALALLLSACTGLNGSGKKAESVRTQAAVDSLELGGAMEVVVTVGAGNPEVKLIGDDNLLPHILTTVTDGKLVVKSDVDVRPNLPLELHVTTPDLHNLLVSGAGSVKASGLHGPLFTAQLSGAASVTLSGEVTAAKLNISGAGSFEAGGLKAQTVTVDISGAASAEVFASESLTAEISGAGSVKYAGKPKTITRHIMGVGVLKAKDE